VTGHRCADYCSREYGGGSSGGGLKLVLLAVQVAVVGRYGETIGSLAIGVPTTVRENMTVEIVMAVAC